MQSDSFDRYIGSQNKNDLTEELVKLDGASNAVAADGRNHHNKEEVDAGIAKEAVNGKINPTYQVRVVLVHHVLCLSQSHGSVFFGLTSFAPAPEVLTEA